MQIGSSPPPPVAGATPHGVGASPTDRLVARLDPALAQRVPRAVLDHPLGSGTVASELERAIRVRFEGEAEPSQRDVVAETQAAVDLLASPAGTRFERAMQAIAAVADGHRGADDLKSITLHPDEHSTLAGEVLDDLDLRRLDGERIERWDHTGAARKYVRDATEGGLADLAFQAAVNKNGHISIAPDVSRELLASLELYVPGDGDMLREMSPSEREDALLESWKTMVHETHHSVTPEPRFDDEAINVLEEAIPTVLERLQGARVAARAGADIPRVAASIGASDARDGAVRWSGWNRDHLPEPPKQLEETAKGRYTDGPLLVEQLLGLAGLDGSTPEGIARIDQLLQGERAQQAPARLADRIRLEHALTPRQAEQLEELIRDAAVGDATIDDIRGVIEG